MVSYQHQKYQQEEWSNQRRGQEHWTLHHLSPTAPPSLSCYAAWTPLQTEKPWRWSAPRARSSRHRRPGSPTGWFLWWSPSRLCHFQELEPLWGVSPLGILGGHSFGWSIHIVRALSPLQGLHFSPSLPPGRPPPLGQSSHLLLSVSRPSIGLWRTG